MSRSGMASSPARSVSRFTNSWLRAFSVDWPTPARRIAPLTQACPVEPFLQGGLAFVPHFAQMPLGRLTLHLGNDSAGLFRRALSGGRRGERVRPAVSQPPVIAVSPQKIDDVQSHQGISICFADGLLGVGERVIGLDWPQMGQADRCRRSLQHAPEILAVHRRQSLAPVSSFTERVDERTILCEKGSKRSSIVGTPCGGELVEEGNDAVVG